MLDYVVLFVGFAFLIKGADFLINGASSLAKRMGVSDLMIGLSVVAFGTSLPELLINTIAALQGSSEISLGNVIGSNIFNILVILGPLAILTGLKVQRSTTWKEIPFAFLATVVLLIFLSDVSLNGETSNWLSKADGLVLLAFFAIFIYYLFELGIEQNLKNKLKQRDGGQPPGIYSLKKTAGLIGLGLIGLFFGGRFVVDSAVAIATSMGISEFLISSTIVAIGTGLPELVSSIVAVTKKNVDMAVGNVVGSNIFNIFLVLGVTAVINPLPFEETNSFDVLYLVAITLVLFVSIFTFNIHRLDRFEGVVFVLLYLGYAAFIILRG